MKRLVGLKQLEEWAWENRVIRPTPEELMVAEALAGGRDVMISGQSIGYLSNGWWWQYPVVMRSVRNKVIEKICDFFHEGAMLNVELDGRQHQKGPDARRDRIFEFNKIQVLRFKNPRIHKDLEAVVAEIHQAREERERERN